MTFPICICSPYKRPLTGSRVDGVTGSRGHRVTGSPGHGVTGDTGVTDMAAFELPEMVFPRHMWLFGLSVAIHARGPGSRVDGVTGLQVTGLRYHGVTWLRGHGIARDHRGSKIIGLDASEWFLLQGHQLQMCFLKLLKYLQ